MKIYNRKNGERVERPRAGDIIFDKGFVYRCYTPKKKLSNCGKCMLYNGNRGREGLEGVDCHSIVNCRYGLKSGNERRVRLMLV